MSAKRCKPSDDRSTPVEPLLVPHIEGPTMCAEHRGVDDYHFIETGALKFQRDFVKNTLGLGEYTCHPSPPFTPGPARL